MKRFTVEPRTGQKLTEEERATAESLVHYPSLERAFAGDAAAGAEKIKQKMLGSVAELERVLRRGTQEEAEKAAKILAAYKTTLDFLDELERIGKNPSE